MSRNEKNKRIELQLSEGQYEQLKQISREKFTPSADLIRAALVRVYASLPDDFNVDGLPRTYRNVPDGNGTNRNATERTVNKQTPTPAANVNSAPAHQPTRSRENSQPVRSKPGDTGTVDGQRRAIADVLPSGYRLVPMVRNGKQEIIDFDEFTADVDG